MIKIFWLGQEDTHENSSFREDEDILEDREDEESQENSEKWHISLDVIENNESVFILAPVAGVKLDDIDISVHDTTLVISWNREKPEEFCAKNFKNRVSECFWGEFSRKIILPDNMDFSQIRAVMEDNLLVIQIPKIRFESKHIKINKIYS